MTLEGNQVTKSAELFVVMKANDVDEELVVCNQHTF